MHLIGLVATCAPYISVMMSHTKSSGLHPELELDVRCHIQGGDTCGIHGDLSIEIILRSGFVDLSNSLLRPTSGSKAMLNPI